MEKDHEEDLTAVSVLLSRREKQRLIERRSARSIAEGRPMSLSATARELVVLGLAVEAGEAA